MVSIRSNRYISGIVQRCHRQRLASAPGWDADRAGRPGVGYGDGESTRGGTPGRMQPGGAWWPSRGRRRLVRPAGLGGSCREWPAGWIVTAVTGSSMRLARHSASNMITEILIMTETKCCYIALRFRQDVGFRDHCLKCSLCLISCRPARVSWLGEAVLATSALGAFLVGPRWLEKDRGRVAEVGGWPGPTVAVTARCGLDAGCPAAVPAGGGRRRPAGGVTAGGERRRWRGGT